MEECWSHNGQDTDRHMSAGVDVIPHSPGIFVVDVVGQRSQNMELELTMLRLTFSVVGVSPWFGPELWI